MLAVPRRGVGRLTPALHLFPGGAGADDAAAAQFLSANDQDFACDGHTAKQGLGHRHGWAVADSTSAEINDLHGRYIAESGTGKADATGTQTARQQQVFRWPDQTCRQALFDRRIIPGVVRQFLAERVTWIYGPGGAAQHIDIVADYDCAVMPAGDL